MARNRRLKGGEGEEKEAAPNSTNSSKAANSNKEANTELSPKVKEIAEKVEALSPEEGKELAKLLTENASKKTNASASAPETKEPDASAGAAADKPAEPKEADTPAPATTNAEKPAETKGGSRRRRRRRSKKRSTRHRSSRVRA